MLVSMRKGLKLEHVRSPLAPIRELGVQVSYTLYLASKIDRDWRISLEKEMGRRFRERGHEGHCTQYVVQNISS